MTFEQGMTASEQGMSSFGQAAHSAVDVARLLGQGYEPTPQQRAVIEAGSEPALVVAGAGSGKTETMAARVVWLIANGIVRPGEVLGLTFTRKAAGELAERIRRQLGKLAAAGLASADGGDDPLAAPAVSTYNSFANTIFRENALLIGREPDGVVLSEASAWQLARRLVRDSDDPRLLATDKSLDTITSAVVDLAHALSDNVVESTDEVRRLVHDFEGILELPSGSRVTPLADAAKAVGAISALPALLDLADAFAAEKKRRGFIEFSDQVAFALQAIARQPRIAAEYRGRYRVVLLDEYQDTSVVQTGLLSRLFAGHPVMAVGDPNQSIYGWRGASAANLARFSRDFTGAEAGTEGGARVFALSTSWRNPTRVLDAANVIAAPLNAQSAVEVDRLRPRPGAGAGDVDAYFGQTVLEEADAVARWFARRLAEPGPDGGVKTAAMLCRSVKRIDAFTAALREHGVRYHVLGIGGLLEQPAVVDLVCTLRVLVDPDAGSELLRLLAGARWRIGPKDLQTLRKLAGWLEKRDYRQQQLGRDVAEALRGSIADDEGASIVEALDFLVTAKDDHSALAEFTPEGLARLRAAGAQLASLRGRVGLDLLDLVTVVVQALNLDIEVAANESATAGRASLDAFLELAAGYSMTGGFDRGDAAESGGGLSAFLGWLYEAEKIERLSPRTDPPEPGTVQILTIHGAKGLEWDLVAVPRLVDDELPSRYQDGLGWVRFGQLPNEFRGDAAELPVLKWRTAETQKEFCTALDAFRDELIARHLDEQRRLAYVALTRARERLLLAGSYWSTQSKPRQPSTYLRELIDAGLVPGDVVPELESDANPVGELLVEAIEWPKDPLGQRAAGVRAAADEVRRRLELGPGDPARAASAWAKDVELLLAERAAREASVAAATPPPRISASRFKDFVTDPAGTLAGLRRPMPERPYQATRLGTLFHAWVEARGTAAGTVEALDAAAWELDDEAAGGLDAARLAELQATFERSEWAGRKPVDVEVEIHAPLAGQVFVCKLDAVYRLPDGRYQIVDWKTGKAPADADDLERKQFQLALYRHAYASWKGVDPESIDAVFYFVADDRVIRPERIYSSSELAGLWLSTFSSSTGSKPGE
ncbi:ATP-dependent helicase [Gryllotalpicola ginsengisoli]|uniref:ATP-dependent helicase n=1 Tax=Gryllotalpicola ginsengisoli TaxID=444608 RepID=UPI0003B37D2A|nr:ATP-dependent DNA helicase [Gryllotalpicola ginsengisoli]